jgi:hypothetical protein
MNFSFLQNFKKTFKSNLFENIFVFNELHELHIFREKNAKLFIFKWYKHVWTMESYDFLI